MDQIQSMRAFVRVVEAGSFTKAAESLDLPKGTVTKQIQHLETRLRVKLLNRTTRRVTVTPDGAAYYERTVRLLSDLDDIEASMTNAQARPSGRLRVDIGSAVARLLVIPALPQFFRAYPDIQLDLGVSDRPVDLIADNVDCVIRGGELTEQSLVARRIGGVELMTVATPAYLHDFGTPAHPSELENGRHRVVNYFSTRTGRPYPNLFIQGEQSLEVYGRHQLAVNEANALTTAALTGLGITQLARVSAQHLVEEGRLVEVLPDWRHPPIPLYVVYPPNKHLSAKVRAFVDWSTELCARTPYMQGR